MFRSLRSTLILPWLFVAVVCCALTFQLRGLFELGIGGEIGKVKDSVKDSAERLKHELSLYLTGFLRPRQTLTILIVNGNYSFFWIWYWDGSTELKEVSGHHIASLLRTGSRHMIP